MGSEARIATPEGFTAVVAEKADPRCASMSVSHIDDELTDTLAKCLCKELKVV